MDIVPTLISKIRISMPIRFPSRSLVCYRESIEITKQKKKKKARISGELKLCNLEKFWKFSNEKQFRSFDKVIISLIYTRERKKNEKGRGKKIN